VRELAAKLETAERAMTAALEDDRRLYHEQRAAMNLAGLADRALPYPVNVGLFIDWQIVGRNVADADRAFSAAEKERKP